MPGREVVREVNAAPRGRVRGHRVEGASFLVGVTCRRWSPVTRFSPNLILREWGAIVGRLLLRQGLQYGISGMYVEFANSGTPVAVPSYDREAASGVAYYNSLADDPALDYLRVPLVSGLLNTTDAALYPNGNEPTFFAMTSGVAGVHGKAFSDVAESRVIGAALVAMPDEADATQDLVLSRYYFPEDEQIPKLTTGQVGVEWAVAFQ